MWEYINQYVSYNTLYHSGAKKEKNSPTKELFRLLFSCFSRITYIRWPTNIAIGSNVIKRMFNTINNLSFSFIPNIKPTSPTIGQTNIDVSPVGLRLV